MTLQERFSATRIEQVFAECFARRWRTRLVGGAAEPFYRPATRPGELHLLHYRSDYFASALHEVSHWCIAGEGRRQLADFGYWYAPDGRDSDQQRAFEAAEAGPQALEWYFSLACGYPFRVSIDNLDPADGSTPDSEPFKQLIAARARHWRRLGLPARAQQFFEALGGEFGTGLQVRDCDPGVAMLAG
jgi:elongation factor P hydroxylase